jgi:hypothetical protein
VAYFTQLVHGGAHHGGSSVGIGSDVTIVCAVIAALAALLTVVLTFRAITVASRTLREAESERRAADKDRRDAEADRRQARDDRERERRRAMQQRLYDRLQDITRLVAECSNLIGNDMQEVPHGTSWHAARNRLRLALTGLPVDLPSCKVLVTMDEGWRAKLAIFASLLDLEDAAGHLAGQMQAESDVEAVRLGIVPATVPPVARRG